MKIERKINRIIALALTATLLLTSCGGGAKATTMHLRKTEGTVGVSDGEKAVEPKENLGLYSGYGVDTKNESYAWIDLDEVKLTKLDQDSEIAIKKEDKRLEIEVLSGSLFFNVTEPLGEDETMEIRTSSMMVGIRGTCGWVTENTAALLEGTVTVTAGEQSATVNAGEMAAVTAAGEITVVSFDASEIPAFVQAELEDGDSPAGSTNESRDGEELQTLLRPLVENLNLPLTVDSITYGVSGIESAKSAYLGLPYAMTNPMYDGDGDTEIIPGESPFDSDAVYACFGMNGMPIPEGYQESEFAFFFSAPYTGGGINHIVINQPGFLCLGGLQVGDSEQLALDLFGFPDQPPQAELEWALNSGGTLSYRPFGPDDFEFTYHCDGAVACVTVNEGSVHNIYLREEK